MPVSSAPDESTPTAPFADDADLYRLLIDTTLDLITVVDERAGVTYQSPSSQRVLGIAPQDMVGRVVLDFFHPEDRAASAAAMNRVLNGEVEIEYHELRFRHRNGSFRRLECVARRWQRADFRGLIVSSRDVSEHHRVLSELERSNELLTRVFGASRNLMSISLPDTGELLEVNDAWLKTFGYTREEVIGNTALQLNVWGGADQRQAVLDKLQAGVGLRDHEVTVYTRSGAPRLLLVDAEVLTVSEQPRYLMSCTDITDARRTEAELRQSQKMEAVGQLTGGVAHDFNNLLGVILGNAELLQDRLRELPQAQQYIQPIVRACERGAGLTQQLLAFSRRQSLAPERLQIDDCLRRLLPMLQTSVSENTRIEVLSAAQLWPCSVDPGQFESAILNLALNARDAMPDGGLLEFRVDNRHFATDAPANITPGDYVSVAVRDTGCGMDSLVRQHVFEPFFTTKEPGRGTGLGLSMVFGFVSQSGGTVTVDSAPGAGATITLFLPRAGMSAHAGPADAAGRAVPRSRGETVLLVEDNDALRRLAVQQLEELGYQVLQAADEMQMLRVLDSGRQPDLMVSDVILTGRRRGPDLAQVVRQRYPAVAVLFMSGYLEQDVLDAGGGAMLSKPFTREQFARAVRDSLDGAARPPGRW